MKRAKYLQWTMLLAAFAICFGSAWGQDVGGDRSDLAGGGNGAADSDCPPPPGEGGGGGVDDCDDTDADWTSPAGDGVQGGGEPVCKFWDWGISAHDDMEKLINCLVLKLNANPPPGITVEADINEAEGVYGFKFEKDTPFDRVHSFCFREEDKNLRMVSVAIQEYGLRAKIRKMSQTPVGNRSIVVDINNPDYDPEKRIEVPTPGGILGNPAQPPNAALRTAIETAGFVVDDHPNYFEISHPNHPAEGITHVRFWSKDPGITIGEVALEEAGIFNQTDCSPLETGQ